VCNSQSGIGHFPILKVEATMSPHENQSEVARFLQQWDEEVEAMLLGLKGLAITARHDFISRRMQGFGEQNMTRLMTLIAQQKAQNSSSSGMPKE
jgi:hypothetical protein